MVKPQYGEQLKNNIRQQQIICNAMHEMRLQPKLGSQRNLKNRSTTSKDQLSNGGHGVCEYMGATHSSQHTVPDAKHSSTCCCPTHEVWELYTPLIVAKDPSREMKVMGVTRSAYKTGILMQQITTSNTKHTLHHGTARNYTYPCLIQLRKTSSHPYLNSEL
ncbi:hypothetical protein F511_33251 [Dorcoceras hygrometricum]|uniref:Uncharacterized protein n=1 Tax=Dorcoceras hygrometricum TaxID=472368 RepID=A0A2Z7BXJ2_9LAMI|nr:hypothetical protein F511_33251 [Dorcoceras hygrometricum]